MPSKDTPRETRYGLTKELRDAASFLSDVIDYQSKHTRPAPPKHLIQGTRAQFTRALNRYGIERGKMKPREACEKVFLLARQKHEGHADLDRQVRNLLDAARRYRDVCMKEWRDVNYRQAEEAKAPAREGCKKLIDDFRSNGLEADVENFEIHPLGLCEIADEGYARYNIRKGDAVRFTLDSDAEHGEFAMVYRRAADGEEFYYPYILTVEGDHFCLRESRLECNDVHGTPEDATIIGRVVRFERGGLPVRLRGLELRGLPYAEDLPAPVETDDED
ncbi:MAG: hypothetical protein ACJ74Q_06230 [Pyrinomonadaceae bacterium]